jgi:hypothetical protein
MNSTQQLNERVRRHRAFPRLTDLEDLPVQTTLSRVQSPVITKYKFVPSVTEKALIRKKSANSTLYQDTEPMVIPSTENEAQMEPRIIDLEGIVFQQGLESINGEMLESLIMSTVSSEEITNGFFEEEVEDKKIIKDTSLTPREVFQAERSFEKKGADSIGAPQNPSENLVNDETYKVKSESFEVPSDNNAHSISLDSSIQQKEKDFTRKVERIVMSEEKIELHIDSTDTFVPQVELEDNIAMKDSSSKSVGESTSSTDEISSELDMSSPNESRINENESKIVSVLRSESNQSSGIGVSVVSQVSSSSPEKTSVKNQKSQVELAQETTRKVRRNNSKTAEKRSTANSASASQPSHIDGPVPSQGQSHLKYFMSAMEERDFSSSIPEQDTSSVQKGKDFVEVNTKLNFSDRELLSSIQSVQPENETKFTDYDVIEGKSKFQKKQNEEIANSKCWN